MIKKITFCPNSAKRKDNLYCIEEIWIQSANIDLGRQAWNNFDFRDYSTLVSLMTSFTGKWYQNTDGRTYKQALGAQLTP